MVCEGEILLREEFGIHVVRGALTEAAEVPLFLREDFFRPAS